MRQTDGGGLSAKQNNIFKYVRIGYTKIIGFDRVYFKYSLVYIYFRETNT